MTECTLCNGTFLECHVKNGVCEICRGSGSKPGHYDYTVDWGDGHKVDTREKSGDSQ